MAICGVLREMGDTNLKNEKGDGDGEYGIAECLHSGSGLCQPRNRTPDAKIVAQVPACRRVGAVSWCKRSVIISQSYYMRWQIDSSVPRGTLFLRRARPSEDRVYS